MPSSLKWYASNVKATFKPKEKEGITRVALRGRRQARRNLTENNQVDTKFLWNSIGVSTPEKTTPVPPDGEYLSAKTGRMVKRSSGPIPTPADGAVLFVAADYGVYVELDNSYLWRAIEQIAGREAEEAMVGLGTGLYVDMDEE